MSRNLLTLAEQIASWHEHRYCPVSELKGQSQMVPDLFLV